MLRSKAWIPLLEAIEQLATICPDVTERQRSFVHEAAAGDLRTRVRRSDGTVWEPYRRMWADREVDWAQGRLDIGTQPTLGALPKCFLPVEVEQESLSKTFGVEPGSSLRSVLSRFLPLGEALELLMRYGMPEADAKDLLEDAIKDKRLRVRGPSSVDWIDWSSPIDWEGSEVSYSLPGAVALRRDGGEDVVPSLVTRVLLEVHRTDLLALIADHEALSSPLVHGALEGETARLGQRTLRLPWMALREADELMAERFPSEGRGALQEILREALAERRIISRCVLSSVRHPIKDEIVEATQFWENGVIDWPASTVDYRAPADDPQWPFGPAGQLEQIKHQLDLQALGLARSDDLHRARADAEAALNGRTADRQPSAAPLATEEWAVVEVERGLFERFLETLAPSEAPSTSASANTGIEPPREALPPFEAFRRFTDPELLKTLNPDLGLIGWWVAGAPGSHITNPFFEALHREDLLCWARPGSPAAPWVRLPGTVWQNHVRISDWGRGILSRFGPPDLSAGRRSVVEEWFDARIAPTARKSGGGRKPQGASRTVEIGQAFDRMCNAGKVSFERGGLKSTAEELRGEFPDYTVNAIEKIIRASYKDRKVRS